MTAIILLGAVVVETLLLGYATPEYQGPLAAALIVTCLLLVRTIKPGNTVIEKKKRGGDRRR
jgi:hypothetical protein